MERDPGAGTQEGARPAFGVPTRARAPEQGPGPELGVAGRRGRGPTLWKVARGARCGCGALGWRVGGTGAGRPLLSRLTSLLLPAWGGDPLAGPPARLWLRDPSGQPGPRRLELKPPGALREDGARAGRRCHSLAPTGLGGRWATSPLRASDSSDGYQHPRFEEFCARGFTPQWPPGRPQTADPLPPAPGQT